METAHLVEFIAFTDTLNYTKAAEDLFISQPALRSHVKALESEVGISFVIKRNGVLELTPGGKLFLKHAREIVKMADTALLECRALSQNSTALLVGTLGYPVLEEHIGAARDSLRSRYPEAQVDIRFGYSTHANLAAIVEGKVDMTMYPRIRGVDESCVPDDFGFPSEVEVLRLGTEKIYFWVTKNNPLFEKPEITAEDLRGQSLLLGNTDNMVSAGGKFVDYFKVAGVDIKVDHQPFATYTDYMFSTPHNGFGMVVEALHPTFRSRKDFRMFSVEEFTVVADMLLIYDPSAFDDIGQMYVSELVRRIQGSELCSR